MTANEEAVGSVNFLKLKGSRVKPKTMPLILPG